jgi:hypothetical protein
MPDHHADLDPFAAFGTWLAQDPAWEEDKRRLWATARDERVRAMRAGELSLRLCLHWASRAPEEVPLLNGEWEFIAISTPEVTDAGEHNAQRDRVTESLIRCPRHEDAGERPGCGH